MHVAAVVSRSTVASLLGVVVLCSTGRGTALTAQARMARASAPQVRVFTPPDFWGSYAIWGATGYDARGHIWFGVTSNDEGTASAHLYELDPDGGAITDRGDVISELKRLRLYRPGERQMKIHSRIVEAADRYQYFASMDESGESPDGATLPKWGGHLWRRGRSGVWEHLAATPQALIAVAVGGRYVYALGYFNHVLFQFDTQTRRLKSVPVGSAGGHVSRNFVADERGHAFVPRVTEAGGTLSAALVEFDASLHELGAMPIGQYFERSRDDSHGIVGVSPGADGTSYFTTGKGRLYQIIPSVSGASTVSDLGWFHPGGSRYVPSLFRDAAGVLYAATYGSSNGSAEFEWVTRESGGRSTVAPLPYGSTPTFPHAALMYGSTTHDAAGRFYLVGTMAYKPFVLQVTPAPARPAAAAP